MKLNYITFCVRDLEKTVAFYERLAGLKQLRRFDAGPGEIVFMGDGYGTMLEFICFDVGEKVETKGIIFSFLAQNVEGLYKKAEELGYVPNEIIDNPPKPKHFTVKDPDGNVVEFGLAL